MSGYPKILLIEPNDINRNLAREILQNERYLVSEAADFWSGIRMLENEEFDLILLEKSVCNIDKEQVENKIYLLSSNFPIVIFCTNLSRAELKRFMMMGAYGFIAKPYSRDHLVSYVEEALHYKKMLKTKAC